MKIKTGTILLLTAAVGCAAVLPVLRGIDEVARSMCAAHFSQKQGMSVEEAAKLFCSTREAWEPWVGPALEAQKAGARRAEARYAGDAGTD